MFSLPSCYLIFDTTALLTSQPRVWQEFNRVGTCFVPTGVVEAIKEMAELATDTTVRETATEFGRFFPTSGWESTQSYASHPSLKPAEGHEISKRSRLSLAIAQATYGLARSHPQGLIVLISNDKGLIQRLEPLNLTNACGISLDSLVFWSRSQRRPNAVSHQLQVMRQAQAGAVPLSTVSSVPRTTPRPTGSSSSRTATVPSRSQTTTTVRKPTARPNRIGSRLSNAFYNLLVLGGVGIAIAMVWQSLAPASFNSFLRQLPLQSQPAKPSAR